MAGEPQSESWKKMVLRSMPPPAWLHPDAPHVDVVLSTRVRHARNLRGYPFPHACTGDQLRAVESSVRAGVAGCDPRLTALGKLSEAERDFLLGSRLISPEFDHKGLGRTILLDEGRTVSLMVNEEDHVRLQALTAGWSGPHAEQSAAIILKHLSQNLAFMDTVSFGSLTTSPSNLGGGTRRSALFHLIGLAHTKKLGAVVRALTVWGIVVRGLYGESSRAVGAFFQVSATRGTPPEFTGACEYLLNEERMARREVSRLSLADTTLNAVNAAITANTIGLADALRVLGWVRWAASAGLPRFDFSPRVVDGWVTTMEVHGTTDTATADRHRATFLRSRLEEAVSA
ncbi:MAG: hypothetical protein KF857_09105 [Fimbriimonadaceae bacterium]|nr:hypothetical protein [Fimbriimonadaceae bacterium]